jgi:hypothetical protein
VVPPLLLPLVVDVPEPPVDPAPVVVPEPPLVPVPELVPVVAPLPLVDPVPPEVVPPPPLVVEELLPQAARINAAAPTSDRFMEAPYTLSWPNQRRGHPGGTPSVTSLVRGLNCSGPALDFTGPDWALDSCIGNA